MKLIVKLALKRIGDMKGSWKTTLMGWARLVAAIAVALIALLDGDPSTSPSPDEILIAATALGLGIPSWISGLVARDNGVTSENAGAKQ